jgi:hypothetical protein
MATELTTTETPVSCPPSAVHDMITTWTDGAGSLLVFPGDLVLVGTTLECVEAIAYEPPEDEAVRVELEGRGGLTHCESPGNLVAVCRYDTGDAAAGSIGYVVVEYAPGETIPTDLSSTVLQTDNAGACWERDLRASECAAGTRWMVCEVSAPKEEDQ